MDILPIELIHLLRPVQKSVKEVGIAIDTSRWVTLATLQNPTPQMAQTLTQQGLSQSAATPISAVSLNSPYITPNPATPQSAALGPAVQATVPSTPYSAVFNGTAGGNLFDRADSMLSS